MRSRVRVICVAFTASLLVVPFRTLAENPDVKVATKAYGALEVGQIVKGVYKAGSNPSLPIRRVWQQRTLLDLGMTFKYKEVLELDFVGEGMMAFSTPQVGEEPLTLKPRDFFYIKSSNAKVMLGDTQKIYGELQVGYFPYKYNPDVRNLGEYMFRSMPYPLIIYADFDYPQANLLGLRLNVQGFNKLFSNDLMLHSEVLSIPVQNWSISDVATTNLFKIVSLGVGISLHHFLNVYQGEYSGMANPYENYLYSDNHTIKMNHDSLDNHRAVKLMGRVSFDPKQIFANLLNGGDPLPYFNKNDGRIYGEIDILGTKNYSVYNGTYDDIADRIIYTFGFNIPGLMIFDYLNLEFEYCRKNSTYSDEKFYVSSNPSWDEAEMGFDGNGDSLSREPWRWSLYLKKSFFNEHLGVILQLARDHKKINFYYFDKAKMSFREVLPTKKDWWWTFKTEFKF